ncbi:MAG: LuxR C-terminal-related transcriptional regulator [Treponema sp.]|jgi:LuxR family maltose regulon positive regulatory protein|nr:LuxR C-terminal-related transcriptional regulator [Treponema sp.]
MKPKINSGDFDPPQKQDQFFHSNVSMFKQTHFYLDRPQLNRLMEQAIRAPLVTVVAGAGYGKTHTVYSFLRDSPHLLIAWLQLSEGDNNEWRFWENCVMTLSFSIKELAGQLTALGFPDTEERFRRYCAIYLNQLSRKEQYIVVFDDLHLIRNKSVLRFIERFIDALVNASYGNTSVILISRTEPGINTGKFLSRGLLARINEEDLRLSREETGVYFQKQHITLSAASLSDLYRDTEGWAFAVHLVGLSLKKGSTSIDYDWSSSLRLNIFKLIEGEVFSPLPEELQKYLIRLSFIDHLAPDLLVEIAEGKKLVEEMEQIGSFIRFDAYLNVYRIHHLFLEYLSEKQNQLTEEEKKDVYTKAARWCADHNMKMDALNYYEKAADYANVIAVIYSLPMVLPNQIARYVLELLDRTPQEVYDKAPLVYMLRSRIQISLIMFKEAQEELREIIPKIEALPPSSMNHRVLMGCYINLGFIGIITSTHARDFNFTGYFEKAAYYSSLSGHVPKPPISVVALGPYVCRVGIAEKGYMERYIEAISAMAPYAAAAMGGCAWGMDDLARAELAYFKGDLSRAETSARLALDKARERDQYEIENRSLFYLLRVNLVRGRDEEIRKIIKQLEAQLTQVYYLNRFIYHHIVLGWYYTQIGQTEQLASWLKNDFEVSDLNSMAHGFEFMVKAKYCFCRKKYPAALAFLENREDPYDTGGFLIGKIEILALKAVCRYQDRDREGAFESLKEAYDLAHPNALHMPFVELGKAMRTLAGAAIKTGTSGIPTPWLERIRRHASAYAQKIFAMAEKYRPSRNNAPTGGTTTLSRREMAVLIGMSRGFTREEIALDAGISVNTVKSAARSLYSKLGAVNRADAIRIASARGILNLE